MLYSEFVEGTGCKENDHNFKVYQNLEQMYMNTDMTKEEVYEYGKKLVDNSKSEKQIKLENEIKQKIADCKKEIEEEKLEIERYQQLIAIEDDVYFITEWKRMIRYHKDNIKMARREIAGLRFVLGC